MSLDEIINKRSDENLMSSHSTGACMEALSRVLASNAFAKSVRLSSFVRYVCTATLEGKAALLCEHHIGIEVFGRPEHYNPAEDTIVRSTARLLRQRLAQYYEMEGRLDELRIVIPRGAYVPVFVQPTSATAPAADEYPDMKDVPAGEVVDEQANTREPSLVRASRFWPRLQGAITWFRAQSTALRAALLLAGIGVAVAAAAAVYMFAPGAVRQRPAAVFWASLFSSERDTLLVVADAGLVLYQLETGHEVGLDDYIAKRVGENAPSADAGSAAQFRARRYTGMSDVFLAAELGKRATLAPKRYHVRFARDLLLGDLKRSNAVIVGIAQSNPWWELFRNQLNFHIDWDRRASGKFLIRNDRPLAGEQASYEFSKGDPLKHGFAMIAYTRSLGGGGRTLLIGGTTSAGTEAAIEFLLNPAYMDPLLKQASLPDGSVDGFEILLQCVLQLDGNTDIRILSVRTKRP